MARFEEAISSAGDALYESFRLVENALASGESTAPGNLRAEFMLAMRSLSVYLAEADGALTEPEDTAIKQIFWLDKEGGTNWQIRDEIARRKDGIEPCIVYLVQFLRLLEEHGTFEQFLSRIEVVFQTVLAADEAVFPEVERFSALTSRLRSAVACTALVPGEAEKEQRGAVSSPDNIASILSRLDRLVGLEEVKREVETLVNLAKVFSLRQQMGLAVPDMSFHLVLHGNPGTGKTTVARIIAELYGKLGLLSKGHLVEVDRGGLVANYIGQTATKVQEVVTSALGGVLFIDEAYALYDEAESDFGREAIATLLKAMEDNRSDLVVIAAGYTNEMQQFLDMNPGLRSRMPRHLAFADYSPAEMATILHRMAESAGYSLPQGCDDPLLGLFKKRWEQRGRDFANARDVRNVFESMIEQHANRVGLLAEPTKLDLTILSLEDILASADEPPAARAA